MVQYCSDSHVSITVEGTNPAGSFGFTWTVTTSPSNTTENTRLAASMNSSPNPADLILSAMSLKVNVTYTITATISSQSLGLSGPQNSTSFTVVSGNRGLNCMGCVTPFYFYNNSCVSQCPTNFGAVVRSDPVFGDTQYCLKGKDVKMQALKTSLPTQITLQFSEPILPLLSDPETQLFIIIEGVTLDQSNYTFSRASSSTLQIHFNFDERIPEGTNATVGFVNSYLDTVTEILATNNYKLINQNTTVSLLEYYPFSPSQQAAISASSTASASGGSVVSSTMVVSQIAGGGGSGLLGAALACELIQLYKFIDTSFPPNLLLLYNGTFEPPISLELPISLESLNINLDPDTYPTIHDGSKFDTYEMSPYFIQNNLSQVVTLVLLLGLLGVIKSLKRIKLMRTKCINSLNSLETFIGWNFILLTIISGNAQNSLFLALNLSYPDFSTAFGLVCFIFSVAFALGSATLLILLIRFVKRNSKK